MGTLHWSVRGVGAGAVLVACALSAGCGGGGSGRLSASQYLSLLRHPPTGQPGPEALSAVMRDWGLCLVDAGVDYQDVTGRKAPAGAPGLLMTFRSGQSFLVLHPGTAHVAVSPANISARTAINAGLKKDSNCQSQTRAFFSS